MLVKAGSDVDAPQDSIGQTALMGAAVSGKVETVKALLEAGANVLVKDRDGRTAIDHAEKGGNEEIIKVLREAEVRK
jgi:ankyrin repeat protein